MLQENGNSIICCKEEEFVDQLQEKQNVELNIIRCLYKISIGQSYTEYEAIHD